MTPEELKRVEELVKNTPPNHFTRRPVRGQRRVTPMPSLACDTPYDQAKRKADYQTGIYAYETYGSIPDSLLDIASKLADDDDCQRYMSAQGAYYESSGEGGFSVTPILQHLWGMRLCNAVLAWVRGFNPSRIRITTGEVTCDACPQRVTICAANDMPHSPDGCYVSDKETLIVTRIEQEISVDYGCGYDVQQVTNAIQDGKLVPAPDVLKDDSDEDA